MTKDYNRVEAIVLGEHGWCEVNCNYETLHYKSKTTSHEEWAMYDKYGRQIKMWDNEGFISTIIYNDNGDVIVREYQDKTSISHTVYEYNDSGKLIREVEETIYF